MEAALILENLNRLDDIYRFVSLFEMKFSDDESGRQKIKSVKNLVNKALINLAFRVDSRLTNSEASTNKSLKLSSQISNILTIVADVFFEDEIKNFQLLLTDLRVLEEFAKSYENRTNGSLVSGDQLEIAELKEKVLLIMSERLG